VPDYLTRRGGCLAFYSDDIAVPPLGFSSTGKDMKALLHNDQSKYFFLRTASLFPTSAVRS
jgi:hypothetical protein